MKLATTTGDFSAYVTTQQEAILHLKNAGFRYIDYSFGLDYNKKTGIAGEKPEEYLKQIKEFAAKNGVTFVQSHAPMGKPLLKNENYESFIEANKNCIKACAALGIPNIVIHSGYLSGLTKEETYEQNKAFFDLLLPVAEETGVNILTENFDKMCDPTTFWTDNATYVRELIDYVDHPLFHCCFDVGHANLQKMSLVDEMKILGKDIYAVHIQDNYGNDDYHMAPFFGALNLDMVMQGLKEIDFQGYFTLESDGMFCPAWRKKTFDGDDRLFKAPVELKDKAESLLYDIGKYILTAYDCFED